MRPLCALAALAAVCLAPAGASACDYGIAGYCAPQQVVVPQPVYVQQQVGCYGCQGAAYAAPVTGCYGVQAYAAPQVSCYGVQAFAAPQVAHYATSGYGLGYAAPVAAYGYGVRAVVAPRRFGVGFGGRGAVRFRSRVVIR